MNIQRSAGVICTSLMLCFVPVPAVAEDITNALRAFLQRRVEIEKRDAAIVVGIVDEHGSRVVSCGRLDNGTNQEVNGDTLFDIASITKPFTGLVLQDMIERGEMKLNDPVAKYLPPSVNMPTHNGKEITLVHLVTHTSGLPHFAENLNPKRVDNPFADYTVEELNTFLSGYQLTRDPGSKFEYSSLGMGVLGHIIALKAGTNYESLVVDRICRPLGMDSTRITLTPELKARFAAGHNQLGDVVPSWDRQTQLGGSALRSTANDMLKFVSADLGLTPSSLTPLMQKTHVAHLFHAMPETDLGLAWMITRDFQGIKIVHHAGGAPGYTTFAGFDKTRRRGVVVLSSSYDLDVVSIGVLLLESEWRPEKRPSEKKVANEVYDSWVGQYELSPDFSLGLLITRLLFPMVPKTAIYVPACLALGLLAILLRRAATVRKRLIIIGCAALAGGLLAIVIVPLSARVICAFIHPVLGIRRDGDRVFVQQDMGLSSFAARFVPSPAATNALPHLTGELLPESETRFFERTSGMPFTCSRNAQGKVARLTVDFCGQAFSYKKISEQPPKAYEPPKPPVIIHLDMNVIDACVGDYEFAPSASFPAGIKATVWRNGDQMLWQVRGKKVIPGPFSIYPESETNFYVKISGGQLTFIKNEKGKVTAVSVHDPLMPNGIGKRIKNE